MNFCKLNKIKYTKISFLILFLLSQISFSKANDQLEYLVTPRPLAQVIPNFTGVSSGSFAIANLDGVQDVLLAGLYSSNDRMTKHCKNYRNQNLLDAFSSTFYLTQNSSIAFTDVININAKRGTYKFANDCHNKKLDLNISPNSFVGLWGINCNSYFEQCKKEIITGSESFIHISIFDTTELNSQIHKIDSVQLIIDGAEVSIEITNATFQWLDCNNDQLQIAGETNSSFNASKSGDYAVEITQNGLIQITECVSIEFFQDQPIVFLEVDDTPFDAVTIGSTSFADVNGNGYQDAFITGSTFPGLVSMSKLYLNDGEGNFTELQNTPFDPVNNSSMSFADVDGDGDQDILITGSTINGSIAKLYINDGIGNFTEVQNTPFIGVVLSSISFADVDGDGDQDVLITGITGVGGKIAKLYINDGLGNFTEVNNAPFEGVSWGSAEFADVDGDSDQDLLLLGTDSLDLPTTKLYLNDGMGKYTLAKEQVFEQIAGSSNSLVSFADVDGDGDTDVIIAGRTILNERVSKLYINDGSGNFSEDSTASFEGVSAGTVSFADVDLDGDSDVLITGFSEDGTEVAKLYVNDGSGNFSEILNTPFEGLSNSSVSFADVDNDGDLDLLIIGLVNFSYAVTKLYINETCTPTVNLTEVAACENYRWAVNNVTYTESGTYTFVSNCQIDTLILTIDAISDISITMNEDSIIANIENADYQWLNCRDDFNPIVGEINRSFFPFESGEYAVQITKNSCVQISECIIFESIVTSLSSEMIIDNQASVFPNPAKDKVNIYCSKNIEGIFILSAEGKVIERLVTGYNANDNISVNIKNITKSYVFFKIEYADKTSSVHKIIIED